MNYKEDPKMQFTNWEPISDGISTLTVKWIEHGNSLKTGTSGKYNFVIIPIAILALIIAALIWMDSVADFGFRNYFGLVFFVGLFGAVLYYIRKFSFQQSIFDFDSMKYYQGNVEMMDLSNVEAIQVLTYHHNISGNYRIRFEINLVNSNGERVYLFNNDNYQLIVKQAELLANKLNVDIWDASNE